NRVVPGVLKPVEIDRALGHQRRRRCVSSKRRRNYQGGAGDEHPEPQSQRSTTTPHAPILAPPGSYVSAISPNFQRLQAVAPCNDSSGAFRVLFSLIFNRSSFTESALRSASS